MTRIHTLRLAALALAIAPQFAFAGGAVRLLPAAPGDQIPSRLEGAKATSANLDVDHAPAQFSWALDPAETLQAPAPFVRESREWWDEVTSDTLSKGLTIRTSAPGALVRFSPLGGAGSAKALSPRQLVIRKDGRTLDNGAAFASWADTPDLKAAGADFPTGTSIFRLDESLGAGAFDISMPKAAGGWLVHVFEPNSAEVLALTTDKANVVDGETLRITADFRSASGRTLSKVEGVAASPDGTLVNLRFTPQADGRFVADLRGATGGNANGLWEIHTFSTTADGAVQRDAKTAFASAPPTARFTGAATVDTGSKKRTPDVSVRVGVEAAQTSRYDVSGVLYATNRAGQQVPVAIAHSAALLSPGTSELELRFAADAFGEYALGAPFEVRDLTLTDQGNLATVEKRSRALRFER